MTIGEQIKCFRAKKGMTQEELAQATGLSSNRVIYDYESGRRMPSISVLKKLATALNCELVIELKIG